jgi:NAD(P)H-hydrate epimerase
MKKIFETLKIKDLDRYTIENEPIDSIDLVERAAIVFTNEFVYRYESRQRCIYIFAGPGNNGADALAVSRLLWEHEYNVITYLINPTFTLSPDCEENKRRLIATGTKQFIEINKEFSVPEIEEGDIVIDGLFGAGLSRTLEGGFAGLVKYINNSNATVVSIDIPSGLFGEDNKENNPDTIIQATVTLTFEFPKLSFLLPGNEVFTGEWKVLPIGLHPDIIENTKSPYRLVTDDDIVSLIPKRDRFAHKGDFGHSLLIAGSRGRIGAAVLSARACLRSGAGLLTVHIPACGESVIHFSLPEAMVNADRNNFYITECPGIESFDVIGIGPGLGVEKETAAMFKGLLDNIGTKPLVVDADALNIISTDSGLLRLLPEGCIITPHPKEFDRMFGESDNTYERLQKARSIAVDNKICIVLKGGYTIVCTPSGKVFFNTAGNPGMATAGSGDVLTGIILGLLSQGFMPEAAAVTGVFLHSFAGDIAASANSEESMIAGDIISMLGKAFKQMHD